MSRVLLVGLPKRDIRWLEAIFFSVGVRCESVSTQEGAFERINADPPTLLVVEKPDWIEPLRNLQATLKAKAPATPFIVTMPESNVGTALELMRAGAYDCLARPFKRMDVLAAAKRSTLKAGRTLFVSKVIPPKQYFGLGVCVLLLGLLSLLGLHKTLNGPPVSSLSLGSATLSGIQWDDRSLWVGNWFDSTITHYHLKRGLIKKQRVLETEALYRMADSQPILVCNTPQALVTVGFDLKLRTHQLGVGLPTIYTTDAPGPEPTGLAWDGQNIWSADRQTGLIYRHGNDLKVLETIRSIIPDPMGLASEGKSLWVMGGSPLYVAHLERVGDGYVWRGPYTPAGFLPESVSPSGFATAFNRLWIVGGGDPRMASTSLKDFKRHLRWGSKGKVST